jgi:hypothetical protein
MLWRPKKIKRRNLFYENESLYEIIIFEDLNKYKTLSHVGVGCGTDTG